MNYTSIEVPQKVISIPSSELRWAKKYDNDNYEVVYCGKNGPMTKEEWYDMEREKVINWCYLYTNNDLPKDKIIVLNENGTVIQYPLDYDVYM